MPIRAELHLILWVTAAAAVSAVLFRSSFEVPQIPSPRSGSAAEVSVLGHEGSGAPTASADLNIPRSLPQIDNAARSLFKVGSLPQSPEVAPSSAPASAPPVLKGIISGVEGLRGVFVLDAAATAYVVAGPGESIGEYRIKDVAADHVVAVSTGGDDVTFNLRGAGEHP